MRPDKRSGPVPAATGTGVAFANFDRDRQVIRAGFGRQFKPRIADEILRMAKTVAGDDLARVPIGDRLDADLLLERVRRGLAISDGDLDRVRRAFERRQRDIAARAPDYLGG